MIFTVEYPGGEQALAIGFPRTTLVVRTVPRGPESCYRDVLECTDDASWDWQGPVRVRVVGGPRRPTLHVRVAAEARDAWMDARDVEGWLTAPDPDDPTIVWVVAERDGLGPDELTLDGATLA